MGNLKQIEELSKQITKNINFLDDLFNNPKILIVEAKSTGYFNKVSTAWSDLMGYTKEECTNQPWLNFVHPEDVQKTIDAAKTMNNTEIGDFVNRYITKSGEIKYIMWNTSSWRDNDSAYCIATDVTNLINKNE